MPFEKIPGVDGLVYVPDEYAIKKKHACEDCFSCQWCADSRCILCLIKKCPAVKEEHK